MNKEELEKVEQLIEQKNSEELKGSAMEAAISSFVSIVSQDPSLWIKYPL